MIDFQKKRDALMKQRGWDRRVATLAVRIIEGVEDFDDIEKSVPYGRKLLWADEKRQIREALIEISTELRDKIKKLKAEINIKRRL